MSKKPLQGTPKTVNLSPTGQGWPKGARGGSSFDVSDEVVGDSWAAGRGRGARGGKARGTLAKTGLEARAHGGQEPRAHGGQAPQVRSGKEPRARRPKVGLSRNKAGVDPRFIGIVALAAVMVLFAVVFAMAKPGQDAQSDKGATAEVRESDAASDVIEDVQSDWRQTAVEALEYFGGDTGLADLVLTMIYVESGGDENVDYYHDVMMAREGDTRYIITQGLARKGIAPCTAEASIYAGVAILVDAADDFQRYLGRTPDPDNLNDMALLGQGYNYGHRGWFMWLSRNGVNEWSLWASQQYQASIGGVGTANHGQKIMDVYQEVRWG